MAKTTFILEADEAKAVKALLKVVDAQNKAIDGTRKMNREGKQAGKSMEGIGRSVAGWLAGFASVGTVVQGIRGIVREMEKAAALRKEMYETAVTTEQQMMKIAHLRGDVSKESINAVKKEVEDISKQTAVSLDVAAKAFFFAESGMGAKTPEAKAAAITIAKFAAPALLAPEEVSQLPKLFKIWDADTAKKQLKLLGQLQKATAESIAETGPYIQAFIEPMVSGRIMGFKFEQLLALMTSAIEATGGVAEAGTALGAAILISRGKTKRGLEYLTKQAKKRGIDFPELEAAERFEFTRGLYQELEKTGPAALDVFITRVGGKGFKYMQQMFGEVGEQKYRAVLPQIEAATDEMIQTMAEQYLETMSALTEQMKRRAQMGRTQIGIERRPEVVLDKETEAALETAKTSIRGWGDLIRFGLTPGKLEKRYMAETILRENLLLALETTEKGAPERIELLQLYRQTYAGFVTKPFAVRPDYLESIYKATEGFGLIEKRGRLVPEAFRQEIFEEMGIPMYGERYLGRPPHYMRGLQYQYGFPETTKDQTKAIEENTNALNQLADKIPMPPVISSRVGPDE